MIIAAVLLVSSCCVAAEPKMHLRLKDGGFASGQLICSVEPQHIGWQCDGFKNAFEFNINAVRSISRVISPEQEQTEKHAEGSMVFELADGDQVAGKLLSMDEEWITLESKLLGTIKVARKEIQSFRSVEDPSQLVYAGISNDGRWKTDQSDDDLRFEAGTLTTAKKGVTIAGQVDLPTKSLIELSLSWSGDPEFVLLLGSSGTDQSTTTKIEVWDKQLVLVREVEGSADIAMLSDLSETDPKIDLTIFFDQEQGTVAVALPHAKTLETLTLPPKQLVVGTGISLTNLGTSVTLERIGVRHWDGVLPMGAAVDEPTVLDRSGGTIAGLISGFDNETQELTIVGSGGTESRLPITSLRLGSVVSGEQDKDKDEDDKQIDQHSLVAIHLMDGTWLSGELNASVDDRICFDALGLSEPVRVLPEHVRELLGTSQSYKNDESIERSGTMKMGDNQLSGSLLANSPDNSGTGLHWQPYGSLRASEVNTTASGSITYSKPTVSATAKRQTRSNVAGDVEALLLQPFGDRNQTPPPVKEVEEVRVPNLALEIRFRSGDAIDGKVVGIEERGMTFSSAQTKTEFAVHDQIDHVWLNKLTSKADISPEKRERLMTVPRAMKKDPPTHLFVSVTGDYLRGRLVRLEGETITIEVRSQLTELPVSHVAQIIWLHDRDWVDTKKELAEATEAKPEIQNGLDENLFQVHSITTDGHGLTMRPVRIADGTLQGQSDLLGETSVVVKELSQLIFGRTIEEQLVAMRTDPWTLSLAMYPRVYREEDSESGAMQLEKSSLIGKPAPEFALQTLESKTFRLGEQRDRIVVLDFWASWCGPCIQTMPLVHEVIAELGTDKIHLVAVNIQESENKVRAAMERLEIACDTLLDSDGQIAAAYKAVAIPQTVIIDRQGNVTHVFVGGGSKFIDEFRKVLETVIALDTPPLPAK